MTEVRRCGEPLDGQIGRWSPAGRRLFQGPPPRARRRRARRLRRGHQAASSSRGCTRRSVARRRLAALAVRQADGELDGSAAFGFGARPVLGSGVSTSSSRRRPSCTSLGRSARVDVRCSDALEMIFSPSARLHLAEPLLDGLRASGDHAGCEAVSIVDCSFSATVVRRISAEALAVRSRSFSRSGPARGRGRACRRASKAARPAPLTFRGCLRGRSVLFFEPRVRTCAISSRCSIRALHEHVAFSAASTARRCRAGGSTCASKAFAAVAEGAISRWLPPRAVDGAAAPRRVPPLSGAFAPVVSPRRSGAPPREPVEAPALRDRAACRRRAA